MNTDCKEFRVLLARALRGRPSAAGTTQLSWHEHLLGCGACRDVLEAEEALEMLLASLPDPRLPSDLTARVLAALAAQRGDALDHLLDLDASPVAPQGLSRSVLDGIAERRAAEALDRLLDRVPAPGVPRGLASDVLLALEPHRRRKTLHLVRGRLPHIAAAAAVTAVLAFGAWRLGGSEPEPPSGEPAIVEPGPERSPDRVDGPREALAPEVAVTPEVEPGPTATSAPETPLAPEPDEELLAALDVLENWELLTDNGLDALLAGSDPVDVLLLDYADDDSDASDGEAEEEG